LSLGHRKAVTMYTMDPTSSELQPDSFPNTIVSSYASVSFSSDRMAIPAGQSSNVTVTFTPPVNLNATLLSVYSGYITFGDKLVLPYLGVAGSMRATPVLTPNSAFLADGYSAAPANSSYMISRPDPKNPPLTDRGDPNATPNVYMLPSVGPRVLRADVLRGDEELGALAGWPQRYLKRGEARAWINGLLADGTVLEEGRYSLRVKALRIFGDEDQEEDWDVVRTADFGIRYKS
jgi:hypothetical protein